MFEYKFKCYITYLSKYFRNWRELETTYNVKREEFCEAYNNLTYFKDEPLETPLKKAVNKVKENHNIVASLNVILAFVVTLQFFYEIYKFLRASIS